jgi:hypothetical protein
MCIDFCYCSSSHSTTIIITCLMITPDYCIVIIRLLLWCVLSIYSTLSIRYDLMHLSHQQNIERIWILLRLLISCNYSYTYQWRVYLLVLVLIFHSSIYLMLRPVVLRYFRPVEYLGLLSRIIEMIVVLPTLTNSIAAIIVSATMVDICKLTHPNSIILLGIY